MIETEFQELFDTEKSARNTINSLNDENKRQKIMNKIHVFVYKHAQKKFFDDDSASDFYLYFMEKIDDIIHKFDPKRGINFIAYLSVYMNKEIQGFYRKKNIIYEEHVIEVSWEDSYIEHQKEDDEKVSKSKSLCRVLNLMQKEKGISLKLYFGFSLKLFQFRYLFSIHESLAFFSLFRKYQKEAEKKLKYNSKKMEHYFSRLQHLEYRLYQANDPNEEKDILEKIKKISSRWMGNQRVTSISMISLLINRSVSTTSRIIKKGKSILVEFIQKHRGVQLWVS